MTEITPLISVCIANFNGMAVIDDCIRSVLAQEGNISVEILVHDDASTDGSVAHIRDHYPNAKLIVSEDNVGFCVANNRMAAKAKGQYLLLLNNDAALYPDALQTLLSEASRLNRPAILGLPQYNAATGELIDIGCLFDPFLNPIPNLNPERNNVGMVIGACLWIPRSLFFDLGEFPEWFTSIAEDMYLCCHARLAGYPVRALGFSGYRHRVGWSFGGGKVTTTSKLLTSRRRRALSERNKTLVMAACYPAPYLMTILPLHIVLLAVEGIVLSLLKRDMGLGRDIYLNCFRSIWQNRQLLSDLRKSVQCKSTLRARDFMNVFRFFPYKLEMFLRHGLPEIRQ